MRLGTEVRDRSLGFGFRILAHRTRASSLARDGIEELRPKAMIGIPRGKTLGQQAQGETALLTRTLALGLDSIVAESIAGDSFSLKAYSD